MQDHQPHRTVVPPGYAAGSRLPWRAKLALKLAIAALRLPAGALRRAGVNRHSFVADAETRLVREPADHVARFAALHGRPPRGVLELGPGRLVTRAATYAALGCGPVWFADVEEDAPREAAPYAAAAAMARAAGLPAPDLSGAADRGAALAACDAHYLIGGTDALATIPDGAVELVLSDVVLEHVRRDALAGLLAALRRVSAPVSLGVHAVDFHDHIGGALNTRRFAPRFWEGPLVARSGLYVNRLGLSQFRAAFAEAGFTTRVMQTRLWPAPPAGAEAAHPAVQRPAEDDLIAFARIEAEPGR
ncbi:hypothetical protein [Roseomonas indoligenes]|uniref:Methyltransferase domain-containing protein n=1 Tax=Roseomonas indoligenes TaxID=2820811 RepID=A0A940S5Z4_9PROT|nr:hypothetical protein [Pararoseomonas indoligenes]MBP0493514.1 hypothetical protein [Pararoseomonas indoligenes]